jgi:acyloxyacyl hydrolase
MLRQFLLLACTFAATTADDPGGDVCIGCQIVAGLAGEGALEQIEKALDQYCKDNAACKVIVKLLLNRIASGEAPDKACGGVKLCNSTKGCILFNTWPVPNIPPKPPAWPTFATSSADTYYGGANRVAQSGPANGGQSLHGALRSISSWITQKRSTPTTSSGLASVSASGSPLGKNPCAPTNVTCNINRFANEHLPLEDLDGDGFGDSGNGTFRNWHWRGRDCYPTHDDRYPGRLSPAADASIDHNCNGIAGGNASGNYEDLFCTGTQQRGLVLLGDSATAHFHIPPQWLTANGWEADIIFSTESALTAEDELDWPQCSWGTGFKNDTSCPYPFGFTKVQSLASRMRERNLCNHRDYQNVGVNGARMNAALGLANSMSRDANLDHPALVLLSLIGNDVCNGHPGSSHMTTPADFEANARKVLARLDQKLPTGSHVLAIGLVDGRVLWDSMHALTHPTGAIYKDVYGMLSCEGANPCWGWLNSNETWRNFTTTRAQQLNAVYAKIAQEEASSPQYKNFKFIYRDVDWRTFIEQYVESGGKASDLIEPVDGFHPSQAGNMILSQQLWTWLEQNHPEALGPINPHNDEIRAMFGSQGGY